jgi:hypothetical protein
MTVFNQPYIRDTLKINDKVQEFYNNCTGDGPVVLLGRIVQHEIPLRVSRQPLIIVADIYDGTNGIIDARGLNSGAVGARGAAGAYPWPPYDPITDAPTGAGGGGGQGENGGPGGNATAVTIYCRRSINANILATGGIGAPGGTGGNGGRGVDGFTIPDKTVWVDDTPDNLSNFAGHEEFIPGGTVDGTPGGDGGPGGNGGNGGSGGIIRFTSINDDTPPAFDKRGGVGGPGGAGGAPGVDGAFSQSTASEGLVGSDGDFGAEGQLICNNVTETEYITGLRSVLDFPDDGVFYANHWAPFRIMVGDYFYHRYNPSVADREKFSQLAVIEFARALELQPDNVDALRLQAQLVGVRQDVGSDDFIWVGGGNNALGLPRDLDVQPDVQTYLNAFAQFSNLAVSFLSMAMNTLDTSVQLENLKELANLHQQQAVTAHEDLSADLDTALSEMRLASEESKRVQQLLDQTTADIQAAMAEMQESKINFLGVAVTIAEVAAAVVAVVAAIPTAGTSLVPLVAGMVALTSTAIQQAGPIADKVFEGKDLSDENDPDVKAIKDAYKKVDKEAESVIKAGKSIVSFVQVIQKLTAVTTPDNSKYLTLVRRGVDLAYQVLVARNKVILTQQRAKAAQVKLAGAAAIVEDAKQLVNEIEGDAEPLRRSALATIGVVQSKADALLGIAFRAQRSVEIYTLEAVEQDLLLDAGLLHPDDVRRYVEKEIKEPELVSLLNQSWLQLLKPTDIQQRYFNYFDRPHDLQVLRLSFTAQDPPFVELLNTRRLRFRIEATEIPAGLHDAKVTGVRLALVGAKHPENEVSCDVRHGAKYEQRREDGTINVQELKSLVNNRVAKLESLGGDGGLGTDPVPPDPGSLAFWGRGIGGDWEVTLPGGPFNAGLNLSGLSEVQVWIDYRCLR